MSTESIVKDRYSAGAKEREAALCCPVNYNPEFLKIIPQEVIERDYGCGDPSQYVRPGDTVLDLGSGTGKICFIASQVVGKTGRVIGVDMTDDMLEVARRNAPLVAERAGFANVEFRKGRIQDLGLDLEAMDKAIGAAGITGGTSFLRALDIAADLRETAPMIEDDSIDIVVSNCVLNLVDHQDRDQLFAELHRVLKTGGRAVISDIVSDQDIPDELAADDELWSGCISGAYREDDFVDAFVAAGFHGVRILKRDEEPWQIVAGISFRSVTVEAWKVEPESGEDEGHAVIYKGPFSRAEDDAGHTFERGAVTPVPSTTWQILQRQPYADNFYFVNAGDCCSGGCCGSMEGCCGDESDDCCSDEECCGEGGCCGEDADCCAEEDEASATGKSLPLTCCTPGSKCC